MRITKRRLRRIIREWGYRSEFDSGSDLLEFARAYASLGNAVQEQVENLVASYFNDGPDSEKFEKVAWEQNPNAIDLATDRLRGPGRSLGGEAEDILNALDVAKEIQRDPPGMPPPGPDPSPEEEAEMERKYQETRPWDHN